jgi:hypothetical protein
MRYYITKHLFTETSGKQCVLWTRDHRGRVIYPGLIPWGVSYTGGGLVYGQHLELVLNFILPVNYIVNSLSQTYFKIKVMNI